MAKKGQKPAAPMPKSTGRPKTPIDNLLGIDIIHRSSPSIRSTLPETAYELDAIMVSDFFRNTEAELDTEEELKRKLAEDLGFSFSPGTLTGFAKIQEPRGKTATAAPVSTNATDPSTLSPLPPAAENSIDWLNSVSESELFIKRMEKNFQLFCEEAWHVVEPAVPLELGEHVPAICLHLQTVCETWEYRSKLFNATNTLDKTCQSYDTLLREQIRKLAISVPPRHGKTIISSILFPAWVWTRFPHAKFMNISYAHSLTQDASILCRQLIQSDWYQSRWPHVKISPTQNTQKKFTNTMGGFRNSTSLKGTITGKGADFLIIDDLNDVNKIYSKKDRETVKDKYRKTFQSRINDARTGCIIVIAQRAHSDDLVGNLGKDFVYLKLQAEFDPRKRCVTPIWRDPRTKDGELLNPVRFPKEELDKLRFTIGNYDYSAQYQQEPMPAEGGVYKYDSFKFYAPSQRPLLREATCSCMSIDMNFGASGPASSYVVAQVWCRIDTKFYLLDQIRGRWEYTEAKKNILALWKKWPGLSVMLVENKANGPALISDLKGGISCIIPIEPKGSKEARARSVSGIVEAGNVYLPDPKYIRNEWVSRELVPELINFPTAEDDDQVDTFSQAIHRLRQILSHFSTGDEDDVEEVDLDAIVKKDLGFGPNRFRDRDVDQEEEEDEPSSNRLRLSNMY